MKELSSPKNTTLPPKVCVLVDSVACFRRALDGATLVNKYLTKRGAQIIRQESIQDADFAIVVTCGFNEHAIRTGRTLIEHARTFLDDSRILVMGCIPGIATDSLFGTNVNSVPPRAYATVDAILERMGALVLDGPRFTDVNFGQSALSHSDATLNSTTFYISVSNGCAGNCSYCVIRNAIGKIQSKSLIGIRANIDNAFESGASAIYLGADDLGAWGIDRGDIFPNLLASALDSCVAAGEKQYIDLRNVINPIWLVKYKSQMEALFTSYSNRLPTLSIALQSGSPAVLRTCNRYDDVGCILEAIRGIHRANPALYSFGHLIVGLPTEGQSELEETLAFVDDSPINFWTCFKYSIHEPSKRYTSHQVDSNWKTFIRQAKMRGYYLKEKLDRVYIARKIDSRYITVNFTDVPNIGTSKENNCDC
jgi:tRNA A37 methylthiotransferase MiaB